LKRKIIDELINWKNANESKPILLTGMKGVGKTYLAYDFAKTFYSQIIYLNFERDPNVVSLFLSTDVHIIAKEITQHSNIEGEISLEDTILILDEVTYLPFALETIDQLLQFGYFKYIIAISSSPVDYSMNYGQYKQVTLYPLDFDEFLKATSNEWYIEAISYHFNSNKKIPDIVHKELLVLFELYLHIGGMPCAINEYFSLSSETNIAEQHNQLESVYHNYIKKNNTESDALKINQVYDILALQLMKENKKFQYKLIRKGTTHAMYKEAIQFLEDHNFAIKCSKLSEEQLEIIASPRINGKVTKNESIASPNFKLYMQDVGMLYSNMIETEYMQFDNIAKRGLLENYVAQALHTNGYDIGFWESDSMAKIDFIITNEDGIIPIEVHLNDNTRSKSISIFKQKYDVSYAVKISSKNFELTNNIKYVPYYAVFCL